MRFSVSNVLHGLVKNPASEEAGYNKSPPLVQLL
jgi:hypothetical protein